jgi:hypothetical protein
VGSRNGVFSVPDLDSLRPNPQPFQASIDFINIELFGIEILSDPLDHARVIRVSFVVESLQHLSIPMGTATVLWRAVALAADAEGVSRLRSKRQSSLVANLVNPPIAKIVLIVEGVGVLLTKEKSQRNLRSEVLLTPIYGEPMKVGIFPTHDTLENFVQLWQVDSVLHLYSTPDQRVHVHQDDF